MKKYLFLALALVMALTLTACGNGEPDPSAPSSADPSPQPSEQPPTTTELTVWGMVCSRCENKIINAVSAIDGVIEVSADSNADLVTVVHEPGLDLALAESAIIGEGFNLP